MVFKCRKIFYSFPVLLARTINKKTPGWGGNSCLSLSSAINLNLFRQEFRRGEACDFLEYPVEVVRVSEAQQMGRFADIVSVHQEAFPPFNHERMDVADGRTACSLMDYVAQIARRIRPSAPRVGFRDGSTVMKNRR